MDDGNNWNFEGEKKEDFDKIEHHTRASKVQQFSHSKAAIIKENTILPLKEREAKKPCVKSMGAGMGGTVRQGCFDVQWDPMRGMFGQ